MVFSQVDVTAGCLVDVKDGVLACVLKLVYLNLVDLLDLLIEWVDCLVCWWDVQWEKM